MTFVLKSVKQTYSPGPDVLNLMDDFKSMVNHCIRVGLETDASSLRKLTALCYKDMKSNYRLIPSYYCLTAISKAAGILASRKKSLRRGLRTRNPCLRRQILVSCYRFKIEDGNSLVFSISLGKKALIQLTKHTLEAIKGFEVRSFTLTPSSLSLSIRSNVEIYVPRQFEGIDRNASNITYGNERKVFQFDLARVEEIARTTTQIVSSFKRNDVRIGQLISSKYGSRRKERVRQILHHVSLNIVEYAKANQSAIVFEDIRGIRSLYRKGNFRGKNFRGRMNAVPWYEIKRQIEYKAAWEGVPVIQLTKSETRGKSKLCPVCGERLQEDRAHKRHSGARSVRNGEIAMSWRS